MSQEENPGKKKEALNSVSPGVNKKKEVLQTGTLTASQAGLAKKPLGQSASPASFFFHLAATRRSINLSRALGFFKRGVYFEPGTPTPHQFSEIQTS